MKFGIPPDEVLERIQAAPVRDKYRCAACRWRPQELGGEGTCATKMQYEDGGRCGFSFDEEAV